MEVLRAKGVEEAEIWKGPDLKKTDIPCTLAEEAVQIQGHHDMDGGNGARSTRMEATRRPDNSHPLKTHSCERRNTSTRKSKRRCVCSWLIPVRCRVSLDMAKLLFHS